jgi:sensitive to high expression protein 9, mitochondrial
MLRTRISRLSRQLPLKHQLSTSPSLWNNSRPTTTDPNHEQSKQKVLPSQLFDPPHDVEKTSSSPAESKTSESSESPRLSSYHTEVVKQRIREWAEQGAIVLRDRADGFTATTKATFSQLGSELNRVTGYEEIEALKRKVVEQGRILLSDSLLSMLE